MIRLLCILTYVSTSLSTNIYNILDDGAIGDGLTDNTESIRQTLARAASTNTSSIVIIPGGDFLTGSLRIPSHITLDIDVNAVLRASDNSSNYFCVPSITSDTGPCDFPFLLIQDSLDVNIRGYGTVNGGANDPPGHLVREYREASNMLIPIEWPLIGCTYFSCRPKLLVIRNSSDISLVNVTLSNSPLWTITVVESERISFDRVTIKGDRRWPNNDGIDLINSRHVTIQNSNISTGDDCIAIVSHAESNIYNVTVKNVNLESTSAALKISAFESDATGNIHDVIFQNITIYDTNRGIAFMPRWGSGVISNIMFNNIYMETHFFGTDWWGTAEPINLSALSMSTDRHWTGIIRNITFQNIIAISEEGLIIASNTYGVHDIVLKNISLIISRWSNYTAHPFHDYRPSIEPQTFIASVDGIYASNINNLTLEDITIEYKRPVQLYYGHCLNTTNITNMMVFPNVYCILS